MFLITIDCAGTEKACPVPDGVETVALSGHWITPGLIDAHVHFSQTGWADGRPDASFDTSADEIFAGRNEPAPSTDLRRDLAICASNELRYGAESDASAASKSPMLETG